MKSAFQFVLAVLCLFLGVYAYGQTVTKIMDKTGATINPATVESVNALRTATVTSTLTVTVLQMPPISISSSTIDIIDAGNSTTSALLANQTFTGLWNSTLGYAAIYGEFVSDVSSSIPNGLQIQFSTDGVNIDYISNGDYDPVDIGISHPFTVPARGPYYRVVYKNGSTPQSYMRLQSVLKVATNSAAIMDVENAIVKHRQALLTKSIIAGETTAGGGSYVNVKVTPSGALAAAVTQDTSPWVSSVTGTPHFILYDTANQSLDLVKQNDIYAGGDHGIIIFGTQNTGTGPVRYQGIRVHDDGALLSHVLDPSDNIVSPSTTTDIATLRNAMTNSTLWTALTDSGGNQLNVDTNGNIGIVINSTTGGNPATTFNNASDNRANSSSGLNVASFSYALNGSSTFDRIRSGSTSSDAIIPVTLGAQYSSSFGMLYDRTTSSWLRSTGTITGGTYVTIVNSPTVSTTLPLYTYLKDVAGNNLLLEQSITDGESGSDWGVPSEAYSMGWDNSLLSWNRVRTYSAASSSATVGTLAVYNAYTSAPSNTSAQSVDTRISTGITNSAQIGYLQTSGTGTVVVTGCTLTVPSNQIFYIESAGLSAIASFVSNTTPFGTGFLEYPNNVPMGVETIAYGSKASLSYSTPDPLLPGTSVRWTVAPFTTTTTIWRCYIRGTLKAY